MIEGTCRIDGRPMLRLDENCEDCQGPLLECLNEQELHRYHWPNKWQRSGWLLIENKGKRSP